MISQNEMIVTAWTRSQFHRILSVDDIELVEDFARWAVDFGRLDPGTGLLSQAES